MTKRKANPIPEELRAYWMTEKNSELGLEFDKLSAGSNKKAYWNINGIVKHVMIKSVVNNRKKMPEPIPEAYREYWIEEKNDELGLKFEELSISSHKKAWWFFKGKERFLTVDSAIRSNPLEKKNPIPDEYEQFWVEDKNAEIGLYFKDMTKNSTKVAYWYLSGEIIKLSVTQALNGRIKTRLKRKLELFPKGNYISENLSIEWQYELNDKLGIYFDKTSSMSNKEVYWKCLNDKHKPYLRDVASKSYKGTGSDCCESLAGKKPEWLKEWDYDKNTVDPNSIGASSRIDVWWKCVVDSAHGSYVTKPSTKIQTKDGYNYCPICNDNSISTMKPEWLKEWNYELNDKLGLDPKTLSYKSSKSAYWKCLVDDKHNSYMKTPYAKLNLKRTACPACNSLGVRKSDWLNEWDYDKNTIDPFAIGIKSKKEVWWKCPAGKHESYLKSPIYKLRLKDGKNACPICSNKTNKKRNKSK